MKQIVLFLMFGYLGILQNRSAVYLRINQMFSSFFKSCLYVQLSPDRLIVRDPRTGKQFAEIPEVGIAHDPKTRIVGVGAAARSAVAGLNGEVVNPFAHPRSLVSDFTVAEQLLKTVVRQVLGGTLFRPAPKIVIHPLGDPAGGFTQIERRAIREMAFGAGASKVVVWVGRTLSDEEILNEKYSQEGDAE
nr:rod shape-determining protein [uncultured Undibacterium sp.]